MNKFLLLGILVPFLCAASCDDDDDKCDAEAGLPDSGPTCKSCQTHMDCGDLKFKGCYGGFCQSHECDAQSKTRYFEYYVDWRKDFTGVYLSGDFNNWPNCLSPNLEESKMLDRGNGVYYTWRKLPVGEYGYKYLICYPGADPSKEGMNGIEWITPTDADSTVDDGYGGQKGIVKVVGCSQNASRVSCTQSSSAE